MVLKTLCAERLTNVEINHNFYIQCEVATMATLVMHRMAVGVAAEGTSPSFLLLIVQRVWHRKGSVT